MAADSMEIDDSLYRQVHLFGSQSGVVLLAKALETTDDVTRQSGQEMTVQCFILQSVRLLHLVLLTFPS